LLAGPLGHSRQGSDACGQDPVDCRGAGRLELNSSVPMRRSEPSRPGALLTKNRRAVASSPTGSRPEHHPAPCSRTRRTRPSARFPGTERKPEGRWLASRRGHYRVSVGSPRLPRVRTSRIPAAAAPIAKEITEGPAREVAEGRTGRSPTLVLNDACRSTAARDGVAVPAARSRVDLALQRRFGRPEHPRQMQEFGIGMRQIGEGRLDWPEP